MVQCANCKKFTRDAIGDGNGVGDCVIYNAHKHTKSWEKELQRVLGMSGYAQVLWPNVDRYCQRFEGVKTAL